MLQAVVALVGIAGPVGLLVGSASGPLAGQRDGNTQQDLMVRLRQPKPPVFQFTDPSDHLAVGVLMQAGGAVGRVGGDIAVQDDDVVPGSQFGDALLGAGPVEGEQHRHRVDRGRQIAVFTVQCLVGEVGGDRLPVTREGQRGHRTAPGEQRPPQPLGERALAGAVETFDDDEGARHVSHGRWGTGSLARDPAQYR